MENKIEILKKLINDSNNIVFFGGAGVSTESNIPDFRSSDGLFNDKEKVKYSPETILSHTFFMKHTEDFYRFYKEKMIYEHAKPNEAHNALGRLESLNKLRCVITQNIDGLHQKAGTKNVLELHGSVMRNFCMKCGTKYNLNHIIVSNGVPKCSKCNGIIKPDVVLYEEALDIEVMSRAIDYIKNAEVFIVGGTSLIVYPAASLINYYNGNKLVLINKSSTPYDRRADLVINDSIGKVLAEVI